MVRAQTDKYMKYGIIAGVSSLQELVVGGRICLVLSQGDGYFLIITGLLLVSLEFDGGC